MKSISLNLIKELRSRTHAGVANCKKALEESGGDIEKAIKVLRKRGLEIARNKKGRSAQQGRIESYIHAGNKLGVLLEVNCETDFVARNIEFCKFTKDLAMQIAAVSPTYIDKDNISKDILKDVDDKEEFYKNHCLLEQPFIKDPSVTIRDLLTDVITKTGENIVVSRFIRYKIGED